MFLHLKKNVSESIYIIRKAEEKKNSDTKVVNKI